MENPYEDWLGDIGKALRRGWDECQEALKAEQAEIVSEYRAALEWIAAGKAGRTTPAACMAATVTRAKAALAKAKGE